MFNKDNLLRYFSSYGSIVQSKILDHGRAFLLAYQDTDSVDRIFLDQPHLLNQNLLTIEKCYNPNVASSTCLNTNLLKTKIRILREKINQLKDLHQTELTKFTTNIEQELSVEREKQMKAIECYIRLHQFAKNLEENLLESRRHQQWVKQQIEDTSRRKTILIQDYEHRLERQQSINTSIQDFLVKFVLIH